MPALLLTVRFHDGRYHGLRDWPPSPARLFQALVAGAARGEALDPDDGNALAWLESIADATGRPQAPVIAAPAARSGQGFTTFVPNNDLDAVGGDPRRVAEIKAGKQIKPILFDADVPLLYLWTFPDDPGARDHAHRVCAIAERLYQLGRGVDMAWAVGEVIDDEADARRRLEAHGGPIHRPRRGERGAARAVPMPGSLESLIDRHKKGGKRFENIYVAKPTKKDQQVLKGQLFSQPPKPRFRQVAYDAPPVRLLFDLVDLAAKGDHRAAWPHADVVALTESVRNEAARRLTDAYHKAKDPALAKLSACVDPVLVGRGASEADKAARVRITPLPSIGMRHTSPAVRRVLVEIPPDCPLPSGDVAWAFSGLDVIEPRVDPQTGEATSQLLLARAADDSMLGHYGVIRDEADRMDRRGDRGRAESGPRRPTGFRLWRTVTPAALPSAARRRIDPARLEAERAQRKRGVHPSTSGVGGAAKDGPARAAEEARAARAVLDALRHAGRRERVASVRVQREPFHAKGARAEAFAAGARFSKHALWHVEIAFAERVTGPLIVGDGRYLGLGLMAPPDTGRRPRPDALLFEIAPETRPPVARRAAVARAVRRALMSRASAPDAGEVPTLFSGHAAGPGPAADGRHRHVLIVADDADGDGRLDRVGVIAPWRADRSWAPRGERGDAERALFEDVVCDLERVSAGPAGVLSLTPAHEPWADDPLFAPACVWASRTPYRPTRHPKRGADARAFVESDILEEVRRRALPRPGVEILALDAGPRGGLAAQARLTFAVAVSGPILLGRDAHAGGGMFAAERGAADGGRG